MSRASEFSGSRAGALGCAGASGSRTTGVVRLEKASIGRGSHGGAPAPGVHSIFFRCTARGRDFCAGAWRVGPTGITASAGSGATPRHRGGARGWRRARERPRVVCSRFCGCEGAHEEGATPTEPFPPRRVSAAASAANGGGPTMTRGPGASLAPPVGSTGASAPGGTKRIR